MKQNAELTDDVTKSRAWQPDAVWRRLSHCHAQCIRRRDTWRDTSSPNYAAIQVSRHLARYKMTEHITGPSINFCLPQSDVTFLYSMYSGKKFDVF